MTGQFASRVLNIDQYRNYGLENRFITDYDLGKMENSFSADIRLYTGTTKRSAEGKGTTGTDYDISVTGNYPRGI